MSLGRGSGHTGDIVLSFSGCSRVGHASDDLRVGAQSVLSVTLGVGSGVSSNDCGIFSHNIGALGDSLAYLLLVQRSLLNLTHLDLLLSSGSPGMLSRRVDRAYVGVEGRYLRLVLRYDVPNCLSLGPTSENPSVQVALASYSSKSILIQVAVGTQSPRTDELCSWRVVSRSLLIAGQVLVVQTHNIGSSELRVASRISL